MTTPGNGLRKPLNVLEAPVYPDIRKLPPRFTWRRRAWKVDVGRTEIETSHIPNISIGDAVLTQSRDWGKFGLYGKAPSYTTFVNKQFRPPLENIDDLLPLSRTPRPIVRPNINPGTAHPGGRGPFVDQNLTLPQVGKYLLNKVKDAPGRPTYFFRLDNDLSDIPEPDLQTKMPEVSASAGYVFPFTVLPDDPGLILNDPNYTDPIIARPNTSLITGVADPDESRIDTAITDSRHEISFSVQPDISMKIDNFDSYRDKNLQDVNIRPSVTTGFNPNFKRNSNINPHATSVDEVNLRPSVTTGTRTHFHTGTVNATGIQDLHSTIPTVSVTTGTRSNYRRGIAPDTVPEYDYTNPTVSATAGNRFDYKENIRPGEIPEYDYNLPRYSAASGAKAQARDGNIFQEQIVLEKTTEDRIRTDSILSHSKHINNGMKNVNDDPNHTRIGEWEPIQYNNPNSTMRCDNYSCNRIDMKERTEAYTTPVSYKVQGFIPQSGIMQRKADIKERILNPNNVSRNTFDRIKSR